MNLTFDVDRTTTADGDTKSRLNGKLAAYFATGGAMATAISSQAQAVIVGNTTVQPFGINGDVNIDFNGDGQIDFQIDHDRVDLGGGNNVDYLQIDKNDSTSATNPLAIPGLFDTFPPNATTVNNPTNAAHVTPTSTLGDYPAALTAGTPIGPGSFFDFQEGNGFGPNTNIIRANRLIDEDAGQVDMILGGTAAADISIPTNGPNFLGLAGQVRYLGVKMDLNSTGLINYGWIGIRIDNEADATGAVVGYAYETNPGQGIIAGQIPEPATIMTAGFAAAALFGGRLFGRIKRGWKK